jgi:ribosomal protein L11 methyltransferase
LSGILAAQGDAVRNAYAQDFDLDPTAQKNDWLRVSGRKH